MKKKNQARVKNAGEVRHEERVLFQQCMRHEHNEQLATGEQTESQTPQRPRIPLLRRIPADDRLM